MPRLSKLARSLTFSNIVSALALFIALGGSAYAVGVLPANSIGRAQLKHDAVSTAKIAPHSIGPERLKRGAVTARALARGSVGMDALSPLLAARLTRPATDRPTGPQGDAGPRGAEGAPGTAGADGPGATRVSYEQHASTSPTPSQILDVGPLKMEADCEQANSDTALNLSVEAAEAGTASENIEVDEGTGSPSFAEAHSANLQFDLPAGKTLLGGPTTKAGEYGRIIAHLIFVSPTSTVELDLVLVLDGTAETCSLQGVGIAANAQ